MAEETNEDVLAKAKAWHDDMLSVVPDAYAYQIPVPLMAAVLKELETVRAECDAALGAVADAMTTFRNIVRSIPTDAPRDDLEQHYLHGCKHGAAYAQGWLNRHENALNTQPPQAEWTPRLGMAVQVKATGERGTIFMHVDRYYQWRVQFTNGELKDHSTDELEPAD